MFYEYTAIDSTGKKIKMSEYKGQVVLIVNTASKCGFAKQFEGLEILYKQYQDRGFVILGFPCGQFNNQEFAKEEETYNFCKKNYGVTFPMFQKIDVRGKDIHPLYEFLTKQKSGMFGEAIKWNFTKFLLDREGKVISRYAPVTDPDKLRVDIRRLL